MEAIDMYYKAGLSADTIQTQIDSNLQIFNNPLLFLSSQQSDRISNLPSQCFFEELLWRFSLYEKADEFTIVRHESLKRSVQRHNDQR